MKKRSLVRIALALVLGASAAFAAGQNTRPPAPPVTLHVGDPAPPISVMKWLKGSPVSLKDGKVHVVEFWATWCGPCKVGMPHLSELAEKFKGQVVFSGISVWEENAMKDKSADTMPKVAAFVDHAHDMMDYTVAADGSATMAHTWVSAAGQHGIPCAFVVDQSGKIAWIGHPLMGLEDVLNLTLAGKMDATAAQKIKSDWDAKLAGGRQEVQDLQAAVKAKDTAKALSLADKVAADMPWMITSCAAMKYTALANSDPEAAARYADELLTKYHNAPLVLTSVAGTIADENSLITGHRDYALAQKMLQAALNCIDPDYSLSTVYASVLAKAGDANGAVRWQGDAVKFAQDNGYPKQYVDEAQKKLDTYKAAATAKQR